MAEWKTPTPVRNPPTSASPSPSKKSTRPSLRSEVPAGPKLRTLSPAQKQQVKLRVLQLQLRARLLRAEERRIEWDGRREVKRLAEVRERRDTAEEIEYRRARRSHSAEIDARMRSAEKARTVQEFRSRAQETKAVKATLKLRAVASQKDDFQRQVRTTQVEKTAFLARVKSQERLLRRSELQESVTDFREKVRVFKRTKAEELALERLEIEYADTCRVESSLQSISAECERLSAALSTARRSNA